MKRYDEVVREWSEFYIGEVPDGNFVMYSDVQDLIAAKDARIAELEANEKAYERILGPKSYQELADEIARLREQLHIAHRAIDSANKHGVCRTGTTRGCNWRLVHAEAIRAIGKE